ncbi:MAG TPA: hypothetical protein VG346_11235 [Acidimicrobiales bacterium]|nr:hypothetical protein [Acidimicrobiales bacterium]
MGLVAVIGVAVAVALPLAAGGGPVGPSRSHGTRASTSTTAHTGSSGATGAGQGAAAGTGSGSSLATAPPGFANQLVSIYGQIYAAITTLGVPTTGQGAVGGLPSKVAFGRTVHRLSPKDLSVLYAGTTTNSGWPSLAPTLNQLDVDAVADRGKGAAAFSSSSSSSSSSASPATPATPTTASSAPASASAGARSDALTAGAAASTFPPASPTGPFPQPPAPYNPTSPVAPANLDPAVCPAPAPGPDLGAAASYSAQVSADVIDETVNGLPSKLGVIIAGVPAEFPDPARIALTVVADADNILLDTMNYLNNVNNDCGAVQADQLSSNIDNTTLNTYALMKLMEATLDDVENSVNTISGQVHVVQQSMDDQLQLTIDQDLAAPATSTPDLALELPASVGGNLDSTPIGVQETVTAAVQKIGAAGEAENPAATQYLAMANAALQSGNDKQAYADFHTAYLEAVQ